MGITLHKKAVALDVDGKTKKERKRRYTNADLSFPADSYQKDLKHYHDTFIPDLMDWAASRRDAFAATSEPEFAPTVEYIWNKYFSSLPTDSPRLSSPW